MEASETRGSPAVLLQVRAQHGEVGPATVSVARRPPAERSLASDPSEASEPRLPHVPPGVRRRARVAALRDDLDDPARDAAFRALQRSEDALQVRADKLGEEVTQLRATGW